MGHVPVSVDCLDRLNVRDPEVSEAIDALCIGKRLFPRILPLEEDFKEDGAYNVSIVRGVRI